VVPKLLHLLPSLAMATVAPRQPSPHTGITIAGLRSAAPAAGPTHAREKDSQFIVDRIVLQDVWFRSSHAMYVSWHDHTFPSNLNYCG
jgi:hypothetical protein